MATATEAVQEQILRDDLLLMDGGHFALRGGQYVICPRHSNQHAIDAGSFLRARDLGYAVMDSHHDVHVTERGWAFAGMA